LKSRFDPDTKTTEIEKLNRQYERLEARVQQSLQLRQTYLNTSLLPTSLDKLDSITTLTRRRISTTTRNMT